MHREDKELSLSDDHMTDLIIHWRLLVKCDSENLQTSDRGHTSLFGAQPFL